eukprot:gene1097-1390_t
MVSSDFNSPVPPSTLTTFEEIYFTITNERLIFDGKSFDRDGQAVSDTLVIAKNDNKITTGGSADILENERVIAKTSLIRGIIGIIQLVSGRYLMVFRDRELVATVNGKDIFRMVGPEIIPYYPNQQSLVSIPDQESEENYLAMLRWILSVESFYYSNSYDITHTLQRNHSFSDADNYRAIWDRADKRFFWNRTHLSDFIRLDGTDCWIQPIMLGFVKTSSMPLQEEGANSGRRLQLILISRRNLNRAGTRYYVRGIDKDGNVANNVETEQIIQLDQSTYTSFVQVRGSIPMFWTQYPNIKYKPSVKFYGESADNQMVFAQHFKQIQELYGETTAINLIDRKGSELKLGNNFETYSKNVPGLNYIWFDFHHICKGMRYDKISILIDQIKDKLHTNSFFFVKNGEIVSKQKGIMRTNCIDNLDRTNVVQSQITRTSLLDQFNSLNLSRDILKTFEFEYIFKNTWADHGDRISLQYSGTGALKNDFTRTGKRDFKGILRDGQNSAMRYYLNNFKDGFRQDSYYMFSNPVDLTVPKKHESKPPNPMFWIILFVFVALIISVFVLPSGINFASVLLKLVYWAAVILAAMKLMVTYQDQIVDKPTLFNLDIKMPSESKKKLL